MGSTSLQRNATEEPSQNGDGDTSQGGADPGTSHGPLAAATELEPSYNAKHDRIRIWANGRWEYFVPRVYFGPGVSMAHQLARLWPDDTIGIIKISDGGTGIRVFEKNWSFDGIHFSTEGQLRLGKMTAAAIAEWYKVKQ